jgi:hypothetical protein
MFRLVDKKTLVYLIMFGLFVVNHTYGYVIETEDFGTFTGQKNGGVGGNNELGMACPAVLSNNLKELQLTAGG